MKNPSSQVSGRYSRIELPDFDQTYVDRKTVEAHMLRAQALSDLFSDVSSFVGNLFSGLTNWFSKRTERQSLRDDLNCFSDSELSDIGLSHGDIEDVIAGTYVSRQRGIDTTNVKVLKQPKTVVDQKQQGKASVAA